MKERKRLPRSFFTRDGITVAKELLGKILVHETPLGTVRGIITEVESYMGVEDKGSHTYGGKRTERTEPMYHAGGTSYVYLIYGMYSCMNIAAAVEDIPQAVLLRSVAPADEESRERMLRLRMERASRRKKKSSAQEAVSEEALTENISAGKAPAGKAPARKAPAGEVLAERADGQEQIPASIRRHLADGPGKLCIAMGITREDNDIDMVESGSFYVTEGIDIEESQIQAGKRIGIDYAEEAADYLWRFYVVGLE